MKALPWSELFEDAEIIPAGKLNGLKQEEEELLSIFSRSLNTSRRS